MPDLIQLKNPWLVAVWPGMGHVAISAGYYLMAKLGVHLLVEFQAEELFDFEHVEVQGGLVRLGSLPRSRLFVWSDPTGRHDIVVFLGEAQPPLGKYAFCRRLISFASDLGVQRVFTFAAMATDMHPEQRSRVYAAATDAESLAELKQLELEILEEGQIGGLNGVLLGAAAERGLKGSCLLGEMPHPLAQFPFPKASLAVLEVFTTMAGIELDFGELFEQVAAMDRQLIRLRDQMQRAMQEMGALADDTLSMDTADAAGPKIEDERRIEDLFQQSRADRSKAYELKRLLDRLGLFKDYEDRFLDLFKKPDDQE